MSPRKAGNKPPTAADSSSGGGRTARRRTVDTVESVELEDGTGGGVFAAGHGHHHHHQHRSPADCYDMLPRKVHSVWRVLRPGRNLGRWISGALMLLVVCTTFAKFSLMSGIPELDETRRGNEFLIWPRPEVNGGSNMPQNVVAEHGNPGSLRHYQTHEIWRKPRSDNFHKCVGRTPKETRNGTATNGYILVHANGGLNQMRTGISDMVAVAKIMNATLVLPTLDHESFWTDPSDFKDIFDWKHFITALKDDIEVVESLPKKFAKVKPVLKAPVSWSKARIRSKSSSQKERIP
ncbi:hypothetical protein RHMOL_Rhmol09G0232000 [Rhododendron molle]|uniref:Uncharacterized protein n=1 Tax=Rhododendron molle TaxID=49168 RepID=A0ACC0MIA5_RHOML|nr:hypothetical protein RHMOL_Rhmol09G0232000 [Rhododendron molle]